MKTPKKSPFSVLANERLENTLNQLVKDYSIVHVFYKKEKKTRSHLLIHVSKNADAAKLCSKKWVSEFREQYQVYIYFVDYSTAGYQLSKGHPFMAYHAHRRSMIYQSEDSGSLLLRCRNWKKYRKKFSRYEDTFHHDHEIQRIQVEKLISEDSYNSVFTAFEEMIKYDLEYLEELYTGNRTGSIGLNQKISNLLMYVPELQSCFVKKNQREYFISELFEKAKNAIEKNDIIYDTEMFESLRLIEESLSAIIEARFCELKHRLKKQYETIDRIGQDVFPKEENSEVKILDQAIDRILTFVKPEQIYFFHQTTYGEITTYYLLLIGQNVNNEKIKSITHSLISVFGTQYRFLLLGHDRYWIQKNLYQHQSFFVFVMQDKHLVYSSDEYHPGPHWHMPHYPQHNDLYFHYKNTLESSLQFYKLTEGEQKNDQGVGNLFALFFLSFCRTYIFVKTFYLPDYMTGEALWQLCIYADKDLHKYDGLFKQCACNIFSFTDYNRSVHHSTVKLDIGQVNQMKIIMEQLMNELKETVIGGQLLNGFEISCINGNSAD